MSSEYIPHTSWGLFIFDLHIDKVLSSPLNQFVKQVDALTLYIILYTVVVFVRI